MRWSLAIVLVGCVALAACVSPIKQARQEREAAQCEAFGFRPGTDAYANCRMQFELEQRASNRALGAEIRSATRAATMSPTQTRTPTMCSSRQSYPGGPVSAVCY